MYRIISNIVFEIAKKDPHINVTFTSKGISIRNDVCNVGMNSRIYRIEDSNKTICQTVLSILYNLKNDEKVDVYIIDGGMRLKFRRFKFYVLADRKVNKNRMLDILIKSLLKKSGKHQNYKLKLERDVLIITGSYNTLHIKGKLGLFDLPTKTEEKFWAEQSSNKASGFGNPQSSFGKGSFSNPPSDFGKGSFSNPPSAFGNPPSAFGNPSSSFGKGSFGDPSSSFDKGCFSNPSCSFGKRSFGDSSCSFDKGSFSNHPSSFGRESFGDASSTFNNTFFANNSPSFNKKSFATNKSSFGGKVSIEPNPFTLNNTSFANNTSSFGGKVSFANNSRNIDKDSFVSNTSSFGGKVSFEPNPSIFNNTSFSTNFDNGFFAKQVKNLPRFGVNIKSTKDTDNVDRVPLGRVPLGLQHNQPKGEEFNFSAWITNPINTNSTDGTFTVENSKQ